MTWCSSSRRWWSRLVTLVTCIQVLYLESLRIRARELPSLQFFKETLESRSASRPRTAR